MPGFGGLAGLSGVYGGYQEAQGSDLQNRLRQLQIGKGQYELSGMQGADQVLANSPSAVGLALSGMNGPIPGIGALGQGGPQGAPPQQAPQMPPQPPQPMGGQPASAMPPPGGGPQAPFAARFSPMPGPSGGPPMMPGLQQRFPGAQSAGTLPAGGPPQPQQMPFTPRQQPVGGQMPGQPPQGSPQMQMPQMSRPANWQGIWQELVKNNQGAPPQALIGAMDKLIQWRMPVERAQWAEQRAMFSEFMQMQNYGLRREKWDTDEQQKTDEAKTIVKGMKAGTIPPSMTGLYRMRPMVEAEAQREGLDLSKLQLQWQAAQRQIASLHGPQMTRFLGLAQSVQSTLERARELSQAEGMGRLVDLNALQLEAKARSGDELATRYIEVVTALRDEMASLVQGGYAPTESAWKQAQTLVNSNYGVKQLNAAFDELNRIIGYRMTAFNELGGRVGGLGAENPYLSGGAGGGGAEGWSGKPSGQ